MTKLVIFDMDGTLIDSQELIISGMHAAFAKFGLAMPARSDVLSIVGLSLIEAVKTLVPHLKPNEAAELAQAYRDSFVEQRAQSGGEAIAPLYPGVIALLERLKAAGISMGVATGKAWRGLEHTYDTHGIGGYFQTSQTADNHPSKPHPSMVLKAMEEVGSTPDNTIMIGDTSFDIEMGKSAGVATIGVTWGYHPSKRLMDAGVDQLVASFDQVRVSDGGIVEVHN